MTEWRNIKEKYRFHFRLRFSVNEPLGSVYGNFVVSVIIFLQALLCERMQREMLHEHKSYSTLSLFICYKLGFVKMNQDFLW